VTKDATKINYVFSEESFKRAADSFVGKRCIVYGGGMARDLVMVSVPKSRMGRDLKELKWRIGHGFLRSVRWALWRRQRRAK